ncbi:hypothetical protein MHYP_G00101750 [Metynnis hypsauchen]
MCCCSSKEEILSQMSLWVNEGGFPKGRSFSINQLKQLQQKLEQLEKTQRERERCRKKTCCLCWKGEKDVEIVNWAAFFQWWDEATKRERTRIKNMTENVKNEGFKTGLNKPLSSSVPMSKSSAPAPPSTPTVSNRPWTYTELREVALSRLDVKEGGTEICHHLRCFCESFKLTIHELCRLIRVRMGADWVQVQGDLLTNNDMKPTNEVNGGQAYRGALEGLCASMEACYLATHDPRRVAECKQKLDETVRQFLGQLMEVYWKQWKEMLFTWRRCWTPEKGEKGQKEKGAGGSTYCLVEAECQNN